MKTKLKILGCFLLFILTINVNGQLPETSVIKKVSLIIKYNETTKDLRAKMISNYFDFPSNILKLQQELTKNTSPAYWKAKLNEAGMKKGDEYVDEINLQNNLMIAILKKYPAIIEMPQKEKQLLLRTLFFDN